MPQLDKATFFTQLFWALFVYLSIYFLLSTYVCPAVGLTLKSRSRINLGGERRFISTNASDLSRSVTSVFLLAKGISARVSDASRFAKKSSYLTTSTCLK